MVLIHRWKVGPRTIFVPGLSYAPKEWHDQHSGARGSRATTTTGSRTVWRTVQALRFSLSQQTLCRWKQMPLSQVDQWRKSLMFPAGGRSLGSGQEVKNEWRKILLLPLEWTNCERYYPIQWTIDSLMFSIKCATQSPVFPDRMALRIISSSWNGPWRPLKRMQSRRQRLFPGKMSLTFSGSLLHWTLWLTKVSFYLRVYGKGQQSARSILKSFVDYSH